MHVVSLFRVLYSDADSMKCVYRDVIFRSSSRCVVKVNDPSLFCVYFNNSTLIYSRTYFLLNSFYIFVILLVDLIVTSIFILKLTV